MNNLLWIIPALPALAGITLLLSSLFQGGKRLSVLLATGSLLLALTLAVFISPGQELEILWFEPISFLLKVDGLATVMLVISHLVTLAAMAVASGIPRDKRARALGSMLLFQGAISLASMSNNLLVFLISWEFMALSIWQLMAFGENGSNAAKSFLLLRAGDLGLYLAVGIAMASTGSLEVEALAKTTGSAAHFMAGGLLLAAVSKSAQIPFAIWLNLGLKGKPNSSGTLTGALLVVSGGYLLVRTYPILEQVDWALPLLAFTGGITALVMAMVALSQNDIRQLLAASSASQKGFILMAVALGALPAAVGFIVAHSAFKGLLFLGASRFPDYFNTTDFSTMEQNGKKRSLDQKAPFLPITLFLFAILALAGVPPLSGWVVKENVMAGAFEFSPFLYAIGALAAFMTSLYAGRLFWLIWNQKAGRLTEKWNIPLTHSSTWGMVMLAFIFLSSSALVLPMVRDWWDPFIGGPSGPAPTLWKSIAMGAVALVGLGISRHWYLKGQLAPFSLSHVPQNLIHAIHNWLWLPALYHKSLSAILKISRRLAYFDTFVLDGISIVSPVLHLSKSLTRLDVQSIDKFTENVTHMTLQAAEKTAKDFEKGLDGVVNKLTAVISKGGRISRYPQTGLLHQYYAQAVVVLLVFILFLLWSN